MADAPTPDELGPLLGLTGDLDAPAEEAEDAEEGGEFNAAAVAAVGTTEKASALRDAIEAYCREKGLITDEPAADEDAELEDTATAADVGEGFGDF